MMKKIQIPNPCTENWEIMSLQEKGRFCSVCNKCVIDFTQKQPHEILQILEEKKEEKMCGRFYSNQLKDNANQIAQLKNRSFRHIPLSFQNNRITLAIFSLILFLTGCAKPKEEVCATTGLIVMEEDTIIPAHDDFEMGEALIEDDSIAKIYKKNSDSLKNKSRK